MQVLPVYSHFLLSQTPGRFVFDPVLEDRTATNTYVVVDRATGELREVEGAPVAGRDARHRVVHGLSESHRTSLQYKSVFGIVGVLNLLAGPYFILITDRRLVNRRVSDAVFSIKSVELIPFVPDRHTVLSPEHLKVEQNFVDIIVHLLESGHFYFSFTQDLTNTLQRQAAQAADGGGVHEPMPLWKLVDPRFWWNQSLCDDLLNASLHRWVLPIMCGYIQFNSVSLEGTRFLHTVISRRSRYRAGARYKRRGIDGQGNVANFVETEQIVEHRTAGLASLCQTRGSVPVFWQQRGWRYKPHPTLTADFSTTDPMFRLHFEEQLRIYGEQGLVSLLDQHGPEVPVGEAYAKHLKAWNNKRLHYFPWDMHAKCKGMRFENTVELMEEIAPLMSQFRYYRNTSVRNDANSRVQLQQGVFRTNCLDCLDRTGVVQGFIARRMLEECLRDMGIVPEKKKLSSYSSFEETFKNTWANNGDAISLQYAGTRSLKGDFTRTGKRTVRGALNDGLNSLSRYYRSNFRDGVRQVAYDIFLGVRKVDRQQITASVNLIDEEDREYTNWDDEQQAAIAYCQDKILRHKEEDFVDGWVLLSINKWDVEQERIILLSDTAYYRVKFDFLRDVIVYYTRIPLDAITHIRRGYFNVRGPADAEGRQYGFRVFTTFPDEGKGVFRPTRVSDTAAASVGGAASPTSPGRSRRSTPRHTSSSSGLRTPSAAPSNKAEHYRTFMAWMPANRQDHNSGVARVNQIVDAFTRHGSNITADEKMAVFEGDLQRPNSNMVSDALNRLGLGLFQKKGTDRDVD